MRKSDKNFENKGKPASVTPKSGDLEGTTRI